MTRDKLTKANSLSSEIKTLESIIKTIGELFKNAKSTPIYEDSPSTKLMMEIKPIGWTGPVISNFSSQFVERVLKEYRATIELELKMKISAFEQL